jgi:hypothetical protein
MTRVDDLGDYLAALADRLERREDCADEVAILRDIVVGYRVGMRLLQNDTRTKRLVRRSVETKGKSRMGTSDDARRSPRTH